MNKIREIETEPLKREILIHAAMNYECEYCNKIFSIWLEKGLEDRIQDAINPKNHKPVPFCITCLCGGIARHIAWNEDIYLNKYMLLGENMNYFENTEDDECGIPHLRNDGMLEIKDESYELKEALKPLGILLEPFKESIQTLARLFEQVEELGPPPTEIKRRLKYAKNPMEIKELNRQLAVAYKQYKRKK